MERHGPQGETAREHQEHFLERVRRRKSRPLRGPEPWKTFKGVQFVIWDFWFMVAALSGDEVGLDGLRKKLLERCEKPGWFGREDAEAKLSQLDDLRVRLSKVGMDPKDLALDKAREPKFVKKATRKLFEGTTPEVDYTDAMRETPRKRLKQRARVGYWERFPVSPEKYAPNLLRIVEARRYYEETPAVHLAMRLEEAWRNLAKKAGGSPSEALALHRAMLTVSQVAHDRADDSSGEVGMVCSAAIKAYVAVPWEESGIGPEVFIRDAVEFAVWEDYGQSETLEAIFAELGRSYSDLAVRILGETIAELEGYGIFRYKIESARAFWAALLIAHKRFGEFVSLAENIGSSAWRPIVTMAEAAMKAKNPDLALAVFRAANRPGMQRDYLAKECRRITGKEMPKAALKLVPKR